VGFNAVADNTVVASQICEIPRNSERLRT